MQFGSIARLRSALPAFVLLTFTPSAPAATVIHDYQFNGTYADFFGGPSLVPNGGTLLGNAYTFDANQGLSLSNAFPDPANYSILLDFSFATTSGYRRVVDFKNHTIDQGVYVYYDDLVYYNSAFPEFNNVHPDTPYRVIITRDAATSAVTGYVNGLQSFSINDGGSAIFSGPDNIAHFFLDDFSVGGEASAGTAFRIIIFDSALTPSEAAFYGTPGDLHPGDANLNGRIDPDDFALTDSGFNLNLTGWTNGDFDHDGSVTSADYLLLDQAYLAQGTPFSPDLLSHRASQFGKAYVSSLLTPIAPEPTTLAASALTPLLTLRLRRRRPGH